MLSIHTAIITGEAAVSGMVRAATPHDHTIAVPSPQPSVRMTTQRARLIRYAVVVAVAAFIAVSAYLAIGDRRIESFYPSLADAKRSGAMDRGWIPDGQPESAHDIHELHRIEHSRTWCSFSFAPGDTGGLRQKPQIVHTLPASVARIQNPGVSWARRYCYVRSNLGHGMRQTV